MFGTMGFSELIIILIIILIIFGAGRLPQIGEGVGKALKGFRKEVNDSTQSTPSQTQQETEQPRSVEAPPMATTGAPSAAQSSSALSKANVPYVPGPELTPGTTASLLYNTAPHTPQASTTSPNPAPTSSATPVISMEERAASPPPAARASYPPLPATSPAESHHETPFSDRQ
ncbi:MAG: twin-arginine translocase TatA/TatE family subunit [Nitrospira sp.]|nr:twin-arginine translocase TatA/TatE family subunit [Nitrospira sp.]